MTYNDIVTKVSGELNLPKGLVDKTYRAYWKVIREHITSLPLKGDLSQEEFSRLQPNVNIPSIGKLCVTPERYRRMKKMQAIRNQNKQEKNVTHNED